MPALIIVTALVIITKGQFLFVIVPVFLAFMFLAIIL